MFMSILKVSTRKEKEARRGEVLSLILKRSCVIYKKWNKKTRGLFKSHRRGTRRVIPGGRGVFMTWGLTSARLFERCGRATKLWSLRGSFTRTLHSYLINQVRKETPVLFSLPLEKDFTESVNQSNSSSLLTFRALSWREDGARGWRMDEWCDQRCAASSLRSQALLALLVR